MNTRSFIDVNTKIRGPYHSRYVPYHSMFIAQYRQVPWYCGNTAVTLPAIGGPMLRWLL